MLWLSIKPAPMQFHFLFSFYSNFASIYIPHPTVVSVFDKLHLFHGAYGIGLDTGDKDTAWNGTSEQGNHLHIIWYKPLKVSR